MLTKLRNDGLLVVSERRVQLTDIRSLEVLAHFQTATLARIPAPIQRGQELIA
jgi:hypothetical protein